MMSRADLAELAQQLAPLLAEQLAPLIAAQRSAPQLVDTRAAAALLGISTDYLREHADELGAIRLGNGGRARLRFDVQLVTERLREMHSTQPKDPSAPTARKPRSGRVLTLRHDA